MFRVKICGIRSVDDACAAVEAGADAIGLNFYPAAKRYCPVEQAREIAQAVGRRSCKVGLFVNAPSVEIRGLVDDLGLDLVQLHGDEPPEMLAELRGVPVMRAFRVRDDLSSAAEYLRACHRLRCLPRLVLLDGSAQGKYGGTGLTVDWKAISTQRASLAGVPLVLAGGLTSANVGAAISTVRPWAVDVASGVESTPGQKSIALIRDFVVAARTALDRAATAK
jgi:phosphoribosylanthranilate isomerase